MSGCNPVRVATAVVLVSVLAAVPVYSISYQEALEKAQRGEQSPEVLRVFREAVNEAKLVNDVRIEMARSTNLAALLLDMANKNGDPVAYTSMYREAIKLAEFVISNDPTDDAALANLRAAKHSLSIREQVDLPDSGPNIGAHRSWELEEEDDEEDDDEDEDDDDDDDEEADGDDDDDDEEQEEDDEDEEDEDDEAELVDLRKTAAKAEATRAEAATVKPTGTPKPPAKRSIARVDEEDEEEDRSPFAKPQVAAIPSVVDGFRGICEGGGAAVCSELSQVWMNAWAGKSNVWHDILKSVRYGQLVQIDGALQSSQVQQMLKEVKAIQPDAWKLPTNGKEHNFFKERAHYVDTLNSAALKGFVDFMQSNAIKEILAKGAGNVLDGPLDVKLVWRKSGDFARMGNSTADVTDQNGKSYRRRLGFRLILADNWNYKWGGDFIWGKPFHSVPPVFNSMLIYAAGCIHGTEAVHGFGDSNFEQTAHLSVEGWYTTSRGLDAKMLEKGINKRVVYSPGDVGVLITADGQSTPSLSS